MAKVSERVQECVDARVPSISFEFFPPKTKKGEEVLVDRTLPLLQGQSPQFIDFTWGAGGSTSDLTMSLAERAHDMGFVVNMHLTCTNMPAELVSTALDRAKAVGIRNICALRGDPPKGQEVWTAIEGGFNCALDLVRFIRKTHADHFCIAVAGYPEGHPNVIRPVEDESALSPTERMRVVQDPQSGELLVCSDADYAGEIEYLRQKVLAGASVIITQLFYDVPVFEYFVAECRAAGIEVPILPGIMPITKLGGFTRMTGFCKTRVPAELRARLDAVKEDEAAVEAEGLAYVTAICRQLLDKGYGIHVYTLNSEKPTLALLSALQLLK